MLTVKNASAVMPTGYTIPAPFPVNCAIVLALMALSDPMLQPGKAQVPGQLLGYGLQYTRMLSLLLESGGSAIVSLEIYEDVGVQNGKATLASQTKSSIARDNPVSNRADPLWKSLYNWLKAIKNGQLSVTDTLFELYVFGNFHGEICDLFSNAKTEAEAAASLSKSESLLSARGKPLPDRVKAVLTSDRKTLISLIMRFRYRHGSGASVDDLKEQLSKALIPPEFIDKVLTHAYGWVKQSADRMIEAGECAAIEVAAFRAEITAYTEALAFSASLADLAGPALPAEIEGHRSRWYVRQLDLISVADERKLRAISAYLRSSVNRTEWARLGSVHQHSLDDFEETLTDYWRNSRSQCDIMFANREATDRGQYLLAECMKSSPPLQGKTVPHDFVEGCFHVLAARGKSPPNEDSGAGLFLSAQVR